VADVVSTHGANLRGGAFTLITGHFTKNDDLTRALLVLSAIPAGLKNVFHYSAAISACEKGGQWEKALQLLEEMRAKDVEPNVITYNATTSACEKGGQCEKALQLLEEMRAKGVEPNVITYSECSHQRVRES
jgi:pentatricopeptide repeat protein